MTQYEMMELLEKVKLEHPAFNLDLSNGRFDTWHKKFGKLTPAQFSRLCMHVLDSATFTPGLAAFAKASKELFGNSEKVHECSLDELMAKEREYERRGMKKHIISQTSKRTVYEWVRQ